MTISHEKNAKAILLQHLLGKCADNDAVLINELPVDSFAGRADIVMVNGHIEFFEVKSEADTLTRLPQQVGIFSRFCDKLHIVAAPNHINPIMISTPEHVAVWQLDATGIKIIRRGKRQELRDNKTLTKLVNVKELRQILSCMGKKSDSSRRKDMELAAESLASDELRQLVLRALKNRYAETTAQFLAMVGLHGMVTATHIRALQKVKAPASRQIEIASDYYHDVYMSELANMAEHELFGTPPEDVRRLLEVA